MKGWRKGQQVKHGKRKLSIVGASRCRPHRPSNSDATTPPDLYQKPYFMRDEQMTPPTGCEIRVFRYGLGRAQTTGLNYDFSIAVVTEELKLQRETFLGCHWENVLSHTFHLVCEERIRQLDRVLIFLLTFLFFGAGGCFRATKWPRWLCFVGGGDRPSRRL